MFTRAWLAILTLLVLLGLSIAVAAILHPTPRVVVVDNGIMMSQFSDAITARKQFELDKAKWDANLKILEDSIKSSVTYMTTNYDKATKPQRGEMERRLSRWNTEYTRYNQAIRDMKPQRERELMDPVLRRIDSFVGTWAKKHGYDMVLGTGSGGVLLAADPKWNVTAELVEDLNALYGKTPLPAAAAQASAPPAADTVRKDTSTGAGK